MKDRDFRMKRKKDALRSRLHKSGDYVIWTLRTNEVEIYEGWGYLVEPYLYWVYPNRFNYKKNNGSKLVRNVHFKMKGRETPSAMKLTPEEVKKLRECGFRVKVCKYKISKPILF